MILPGTRTAMASTMTRIRGFGVSVSALSPLPSKRDGGSNLKAGKRRLYTWTFYGKAVLESCEGVATAADGRHHLLGCMPARGTGFISIRAANT